VISLALPGGPLRILCLAAHPDDIEIGCGGTLLELASRHPVEATVAVMSGSASRREEAQGAAAAFLPGAAVRFWDFEDGRLPARWGDVKDALEGLAEDVTPDLVLCPSREDAHQDHRLLGELVPTVWRDHQVLEYEIPKWDGDLRRVTHYVPVSEENARRKVDLLNSSFPSQAGHDWWDDETFLGLMRLRGIECRHRYAEGFVLRKSVISMGGSG
jgi:LmbE family N-acetylglucosaminyl deacetylase